MLNIRHNYFCILKSQRLQGQEDIYYLDLISDVEKLNFRTPHVITDLENQEKQEVYGNLVIPYDSLNPDKKYPLVLGVAGSLGWKNHHYEYLTMYQNLGFATFELNSGPARGNAALRRGPL